jgi:hypothetical protein
MVPTFLFCESLKKSFIHFFCWCSVLPSPKFCFSVLAHLGPAWPSLLRPSSGRVTTNNREKWEYGLGTSQLCIYIRYDSTSFHTNFQLNDINGQNSPNIRFVTFTLPSELNIVLLLLIYPSCESRRRTRHWFPQSRPIAHCSIFQTVCTWCCCWSCSQFLPVWFIMHVVSIRLW